MNDEIWEETRSLLAKECVHVHHRVATKKVHWRLGGDAIDRVQFIERLRWTGAKADGMNVAATGYSGGPGGFSTTLFGRSP